jgi:OmcA/MtrC family decaheme c-type cytochrome
LNYQSFTRGMLAALLGLSLAACSGDDGSVGPAGAPGQDGADGDVGPIGPQGPGAQIPAGDGLKIEIQSTTIAADGTVVVTFKATDAAGKAIDAVAERTATQAKVATNNGFEPRFTLAMITAAGASQSIYLSTTGTPSSDRYGALAPTATAGVFAYTFEKKIIPTDAALTHTVGVWAYRYDAAKVRYPSSDTFTFVPAGGTPVVREIVADAACNACHGTLTLHGSRQGVALCATCHTSQLAAGEANLVYMAHKIHAGEHLTKGYKLGGQDFSEVTFPQTIKNCVACHKGANADNWQTKPSIAACGSCHDTVVFAARALVVGEVAHTGGVTDDTACTTCHKPGGYSDVAKAHAPVVPPNPGASFTAGGAAGRLNAGYVAAAGYVPAGADVLSYDVKRVFRDANENVNVVFKLKNNGTDVAFQAYAPAATPAVTELMPNFVGTPVVYVAFAVPQDGIAKPADFNVTASAQVKRIWNGTLTTSTMTGPDAEGYYTVTIKDVKIPATATMLTGGLGYEYSLPNSQPLTQTNVAAYPYDATTGFGGLIVPIPDKVISAETYTARRTIVANAKCNACHGFLGVAPTFHVGQRNDAPTCAFCHNPNKATGSQTYGWSANAKNFVHAIHGAGKRQEQFTWESSAGASFWEVTYPNELNNCEACHVAGTYDFSAAASKAAVPNLLASTVAAGTYTGAVAPYISAGVEYGANFTFVKADGTSSEPAPSTLVVTPITSACSSCHDSDMAVAHMEQNGGTFYGRRDATETETCLLCHGPGKVAAIAEMHK